MTIVSRTVYDRQFFAQFGQEDIITDQNLDDRTTFAHFPNSIDREFLIDAVSSGAFPAQRTENDKITFTDTEIIAVIEWLSQEHCQSWVDRKNQARFPGLISCEMIVS